MARHSFIQMSKLSNVKGRISYISDPKRQEYLYATFSTREDMTFWNDLAKECQEEFKRFGTEGKCIEARELIIALPEEYTKFDPNQVLREFTEQFKKRYDVECVSALHHNKTKKNYHIHLIFSERRLLPEPEVKIATRSVFYDELGKRVRTKKEITGEDGQIREGCIVCALPGFVDSKNEEKTERNAGYLVVSHSGGGMLRQGTRKGIRRTPANRGMRAHRIVKSLDISEDVCHGLCP